MNLENRQAGTGGKRGNERTRKQARAHRAACLLVFLCSCFPDSILPSKEEGPRYATKTAERQIQFHFRARLSLGMGGVSEKRDCATRPNGPVEPFPTRQKIPSASSVGILWFRAVGENRLRRVRPVSESASSGRASRHHRASALWSGFLSGDARASDGCRVGRPRQSRRA